VDLEYIFGELSNSDGEFPLDYPAAAASSVPFNIVATNALNGQAHYFDMSDIEQDDYDAIKASSCVPAVNKPFFVNGIPYYDGGISDPIPIVKCFEEGCDRVVLIMTRPRDYQRTPQKDEVIAIIDDVNIPNERKKLKIKELDHGRVWNRMLKEIYPQLRSARYLAVYYDPSDDALVEKVKQANSLINEGKYEEAYSLVEKYKDDSRAANVLGVSLMMQKKFEEAMPWLKKAAEGGCEAALENIAAINAEYEYEAKQARIIEEYLKTLE
jgi:predicted patatin/cPLA2 family phospholipase